MRVWVASLMFYSSVFAGCEILRFVVVKALNLETHRLAALLFFEFIGTIQICTPMFDVGTILDTYGLWGIFIEITAIEAGNFVFMREAVAHPCPLLTSSYRKWKLIRRATYLFGIQMLAAYLSFHLAKSFWKLGIHQKHIELLNDSSCTADLTVSLTVGCLIEGAATFLAKAFEKCSAQFINERFTTIANCSFSGFICALGINYTGMYANPVVAWACTFNCEGVSHIGHLVVYWLSPLIAWYAAELTFGEEDVVEEEIEQKEEKVE